MSEFRVAGVRLDALLSLEPGAVINAVPEDHRPLYNYWRGVHLGKVALNLMRGRMRINTGENEDLIFFSSSYESAERVAGNTARRRRDYQWRDADAALYRQLTGQDAPDSFAAAIVAHQYRGQWDESDLGWGHSTTTPVCFRAIDGHTLVALEQLFDADLLASSERAVPHAPIRPTPNAGPENYLFQPYGALPNPAWR